MSIMFFEAVMTARIKEKLVRCDQLGCMW